MKTRGFAGAFLHWENEVVLLQRSMQKKISPGCWAGIGGHIESTECSEPYTACLREIKEETGIGVHQIAKMDLRYVCMITTHETLDSVYYYTAALHNKCPLPDCDEGKLFWIKKEEALQYPMAQHMQLFYRHWLENPDFEGIYGWMIGENGTVSHQQLY